MAVICRNAPVISEELKTNKMNMEKNWQKYIFFHSKNRTRCLNNHGNLLNHSYQQYYFYDSIFSLGIRVKPVLCEGKNKSTPKLPKFQPVGANAQAAKAQTSVLEKNQGGGKMKAHLGAILLHIPSLDVRNAAGETSSPFGGTSTIHRWYLLI